MKKDERRYRAWKGGREGSEEVERKSEVSMSVREKDQIAMGCSKVIRQCRKEVIRRKEQGTN